MNKNDRDELYNQWVILPNRILKKKYKFLNKIQNTLALIPIIMLIIQIFNLGFSGWTNFMIFEMSGGSVISSLGLSIIFYIVWAIQGLMLIIDELRLQKINLLVFSIIYSAFLWMFIMSDSDMNVIIECICVAYIIIATLINIPLIEKQLILKSLPSFPFVNRFESTPADGVLTRAEMVKYLENAQKGNKCISNDYEEILDGNFRKINEEKPNKDEFFQQYKNMPTPTSSKLKNKF